MALGSILQPVAYNPSALADNDYTTQHSCGTKKNTFSRETTASLPLAKPSWRTFNLESRMTLIRLANPADNRCIAMISAILAPSPAAWDALRERWGEPADAHDVAGIQYGNVFVGLQPARAGVKTQPGYHDPELIPTWHYIAFYAWLQPSFWSLRHHPLWQAW